MNKQLGIMDIVDMLLRRWWVLIISMIIGGVVIYFWTAFFVQPQYASEGALYVNSNQYQQDTALTQTTINASQQLVVTYAEILKRRTFLEQVVRDLDGKFTVNQISAMLNLASVNKTEILSIRVTGADPEDVYRICHSILMRAPDELVRVVEAGSVKLLDDASMSTVPISPNVQRNTILGIILGLALGGLFIVLLELFDTRIKSGEEITARYEEPLLGEIPSLEHGSRESRG